MPRLNILQRATIVALTKTIFPNAKLQTKLAAPRLQSRRLMQDKYHATNSTTDIAHYGCRQVPDREN